MDFIERVFPHFVTPNTDKHQFLRKQGVNTGVIKLIARRKQFTCDFLDCHFGTSTAKHRVCAIHRIFVPNRYLLSI